ncbi:hypothetical protein KSA87_18355, partial [Acinetobacter baumannii]|nr:hypothetical protein [Acinetobacter baumannii]
NARISMLSECLKAFKSFFIIKSQKKSKTAFKTALCFRFAQTLLNLAALDSWEQFFQRQAKTLKTRMDSLRS